MTHLEQKFNTLGKFSAKVMHRSATTLLALQKMVPKGQEKTDKKMEYEDMLQFLVDDWDKIFE